MKKDLSKIFEQYFKKHLNCKFVTDFKGIVPDIKKDCCYDVFKDCEEAQWDKTLDMFAECGEGYFIFSEHKIDIICQGEGWYYLDIDTEDFFIRIENDREFTFYKKNNNDEFCDLMISRNNIETMFKYLNEK